MREVYNALPDDRPITSLCVVEEVAKCLLNYTVVARTHDQDVDADLYKDGFFRRVTRYLCHSKTEGYHGYVVEQLVVVADRDSCPPGFTTITTTMDSNQKAFKKKQICFKALSKNMANQIITDIIVLSNNKVAPEGFTLAGELNGMCVCYKPGPAPNTQQQPQQPPPNRPPLPYQIAPQVGPGGRSVSAGSLYPGLERPTRPAPLPPGGAPYTPPPGAPYTPPYYHRPLPAAPTQPHRASLGGGGVGVGVGVGGVGSETYETTQSALYGVPFTVNKKVLKDGQTRTSPSIAANKSSQQLESEYYYSFTLEHDVLQRPANT